MRRIFRPLVAVAAAGLVTTCGDSFGPINDLPRQLTVAEGKLVEADNRFAFKLFREIAVREEPDANILISPLSVAMALGMTYNGAAGDTREAMAATLELDGMTIEEVNEAYRGLIDLLQDLDAPVEWRLANSIWYRDDLTPLPTFLDINRTFFDAEVAALDFSDPAAADVINAWVRDKTGGRITEIVDKPIPSNVLMHLLNAIYFKGDWTYQFDKDLTAPRPFALADGSMATVEMMAHRGLLPLPYARVADVEVVDLPFARQAYSMTIIVPREPQALRGLTETLTQDQWNAWLAALDSTEGTISMPRFTLEYGLELNDVLKALGMGIAFTPGEADFSNIFGSRGPWIDKVKHKTFVEVNEVGTEAAAVTDVVIVVSHGGPHMVVDRPFFFVIRERFSGTVLFMGRIMNPAA